MKHQHELQFFTHLQFVECNISKKFTVQILRMFESVAGAAEKGIERGVRGEGRNAATRKRTLHGTHAQVVRGVPKPVCVRQRIWSGSDNSFRENFARMFREQNGSYFSA